MLEGPHIAEKQHHFSDVGALRYTFEVQGFLGTISDKCYGRTSNNRVTSSHSEALAHTEFFRSWSARPHNVLPVQSFRRPLEISK